jgi:hypothetical protein
VVEETAEVHDASIVAVIYVLKQHVKVAAVYFKI